MSSSNKIYLYRGFAAGFYLSEAQKPITPFTHCIRVYSILIHTITQRRGAGGESWNHRVHRVATAAFWRTFSHEGKISPDWWDGGCTQTPFYYIYHHQESYSVRSNWVGRHTNPVSSLGKYVLCGWNRKKVRGHSTQSWVENTNMTDCLSSL
jgi:hypothetical protein